MEFTFETLYNQKAVTTMAKTLRKTLVRRKSLCTAIATTTDQITA